MQVAGREKFSLTCSDPAVPGSGLTLRAMAIAAAVIGDGGTMPAAGALIEMTAECGGTTPANGQQHFDVLPTEPVTKRVRMNTFLEARSLGGFLASVPDHLGVNRRITGMPAVAWKQPCAWLVP